MDLPTPLVFPTSNLSSPIVTINQIISGYNLGQLQFSHFIMNRIIKYRAIMNLVTLL